MSAPLPPFTHVVLWMRGEAWPLTSTVVAADALRHDEDRITLLREGRIVFQAREVDVAEVEPHPSRDAAQRAIEERRSLRGRGGLRVEELATPRAATGAREAVARGAPAEALAFRIEEG